MRGQVTDTEQGYIPKFVSKALGSERQAAWCLRSLLRPPKKGPFISFPYNPRIYIYIYIYIYSIYPNIAPQIAQCSNLRAGLPQRRAHCRRSAKSCPSLRAKRGQTQSHACRAMKVCSGGLELASDLYDSGLRSSLRFRSCRPDLRIV